MAKRQPKPANDIFDLLSSPTPTSRRKRTLASPNAMGGGPSGPAMAGGPSGPAMAGGPSGPAMSGGPSGPAMSGGPAAPASTRRRRTKFNTEDFM